MKIQKLKKRFIELATKTVVMIGRTKEKFLTIHTRPMFEKKMPYQGIKSDIDATCAIIVQGAIKKNYRFTLETVKLYAKHYPSATIIVSTWENEDTRKFEALASAGLNIQIVKSPRPEFGGPGNVNMQVTSTKAGIKLAQSLGLLYVMKTRTDQRMYGIKSIEFLVNLMHIFPLAPGLKQKKRVIGLNITTTTRYTPYHFSDTWMFGTTEDMSAYWDFKYIKTPAPDPRRPLIERQLFMSFLEKTGWKTQDTMEDFLKALGERCIVVGNESIDIYWPKYYEQFREYRIRDYEYPQFEISFKEWFSKCSMPYMKNNGS